VLELPAQQVLLVPVEYLEPQEYQAQQVLLVHLDQEMLELLVQVVLQVLPELLVLAVHKVLLVQAELLEFMVPQV
jgi:hypothetical protein